jgi:GNAT superfamily N-acetyltransferase
MEIKNISKSAVGTKFYIEENGKEIGRAYLYIIFNDLHKDPFGFLEDVFVNENHRGKGIGSKLVEKVIEEAKKENCYKLICTSRYKNTKVHKLYESFGFKDHGKEFRMDF